MNHAERYESLITKLSSMRCRGGELDCSYQAALYGLSWESVPPDDPQAMVDALADGKLVVAIMAKGHFTNSGHFIVLRGVTAEGKILVADPASRKRSEQEWDLSIILDEARKGAAAGGPFWAIY